MIRRISFANKNAERLARVKQLFGTENRKIELQIEDWVKNALLCKCVYSSFSHVEFHDINIQVYEAKISDYQLVRSSNTNILVETQVRIYLRVEIEIDDDE